MRKIITKDETKNLNKFGLLKLDYLKKNNKVLYQRLIIEDKLNTFLFSVGKEAEEKLKFLINELAEKDKLPNLCTVINGLDLKKRKYGYYYGYGKYGKYYGYGKRYGYGYGYGEQSHTKED